MSGSVLGSIEGTNFADWPITYDELEPYYSKVEWDMGVSGAPGHSEPPRSRPFPMPPLPINSSGVIMEKGAKALGLHADAQPHAILSEVYNGRAPCLNCGFCSFYGCEMGAKSSSLAAMIPLAEASGNCEIRPESTVFRVVKNAEGKVSEVLYYDKDGNEQGQKARAVVLSANGAETPRLLMESDDLANSSGYVGRNLMFNAHASAEGVFEHQLNEYKGVQATRVIMDYYDSDPNRGFYGGGGIDARRRIVSNTVDVHHCRFAAVREKLGRRIQRNDRAFIFATDGNVYQFNVASNGSQQHYLTPNFYRQMGPACDHSHLQRSPRRFRKR